MVEEIVQMTQAMVGASDRELDDLTALCAAEERALRQRMKEPPAEEDRYNFICAASWYAAADYYCAKDALGAASWKAGEVSVQSADGARNAEKADALRRAADRLLRAGLRDDGFAFWGVRG